jgi:hypothetical protein
MPKIPRPKEINGSAVLLVEGDDELNFFGAFLRHLRIEGVDLLDLKGKRQFKHTIPAALKMPGFSNARVYAVVRDADNNADGAFESVRNILRDNKQPFPQARNTFTDGPPKVGIFIVPGDFDTGMLEDLCMGTVSDHAVIPCVDEFMACITRMVVFPPHPDPDAPHVENFKAPNNPNKARAKAFLAAQPHDLPSVGVAAQADVWNFDHPCLNDLKAFLQQLSGA